MPFHETRFPLAVSLGASGGPERRTDIVTLGSGHEQRNQRWADSRRKYDAGIGIRNLDELYTVLAFFEERRGRLHGFRWRDYADCKSCAPGQAVTALDQQIGTGDGADDTFQLVKIYGGAFSAYTRTISKPVAGTVRVAVAGIEQAEGTAWTVDATTGVVTFGVGHIPAAGQAVTAGYEFDVPVRFDADTITVSVANFAQGSIPQIPVVEIRI
jgi:uncharacterized protein (TIGR02217 family)